LGVRKFLGMPFVGIEKLPGFLGMLLSPKTAGTDPVRVIKKAADHESKLSIKPIEVLPRLKEGGAFVKYSHDGTASPSEVERVLDDYLRKEKVKPWWSPWRRMRVSIVKGRPWVEDLVRFPNQRLKVEFIPSSPGAEAVELAQEQLYAFFRPYGKLGDITPQPPDSKLVPRFAYLDFMTRPRAIMAKNCMHGYLVSEAEGGGKTGTVLRLTYEQRIKAHWIRDWLVNHPRIVIPAIAAIVAGITVAVFDP
jgi:hypothetical protein